MAGSRYFDAIWSRVAEEARPGDFEARREFLLGHVTGGARVLDLGCGTGEFSAALARAGATVVAAEVSGVALSRARARHEGLDLRLVPESGPLPLDDAEFDVVWAGEVIERVVDIESWLSEVRRVLRPGGRLVLSTPWHGRPGTALALLRSGGFEEHFHPGSDRVRFYTASSLRRVLEDFSFEAVSVQAAGGWPGWRRSLRAVARRGRW